MYAAFGSASVVHEVQPCSWDGLKLNWNYMKCASSSYASYFIQQRSLCLVLDASGAFRMVNSGWIICTITSYTQTPERVVWDCGVCVCLCELCLWVMMGTVSAWCTLHNWAEVNARDDFICTWSVVGCCSTQRTTLWYVTHTYTHTWAMCVCVCVSVCLMSLIGTHKPSLLLTADCSRLICILHITRARIRAPHRW